MGVNVRMVGSGRVVVNDQQEEDEVRAAEASGSPNGHFESVSDQYGEHGLKWNPRDLDIIYDARCNLGSSHDESLPVVDDGKFEDGALNSRWASWQDAMYTAIHELSSCVGVLRYAQKYVPFDHREPANQALIEIYDGMLAGDFPLYAEMIGSLGENPRSLPETLIKRDGRLLSNIFFWHIRGMLAQYQYAGQPKRILEIGGGYGALARLWLTNAFAGVERYVIADLPESLFFAEVSLRDEFGADVGYWNGSDPGTKVVLLPISRLNQYKTPSDLVISMGSMQELSDVWVNFYMKWLDEYPAKWFYSVNYMGQPLSQLMESRCYWGPRPSTKWATRLLNPDVPLFKSQCCGRYFCEVLYEKAPPRRSIDEWSVLRGAMLTRNSYLEGLELLREKPTIDNGAKLLAGIVAFSQRTGIPFPAPKEVIMIATSIVNGGRLEFQPMLDALSATRKQVAR